ncbi:hypothetical protein C1H46_037629 [Malus baccata]|uniref:Uncharacterized protein n=1 Tax=Malus baccata TaxID=106549 RepID=A0A540KRS5_MALBA|nr:hypothetical protein C1H46_037629 [Malus baccata]
MAERAFDLAVRLTEKLGSLAYDEICLAWAVQSDLRKLEGTMSTIEGVLLDAEEKQANNKELRSWLRQVKNVFLDAEDVLDEFECEALRKQVVKKFHGTCRKVRRFFSRSNPVAFRLRVAHEIKELWERLEELKANKSIFDSLTSHSKGYYDDHDSNLKHVIKARETHSFVRASEVVGREFEKEELVDRLIEQGLHSLLLIKIWMANGILESHDHGNLELEDVGELYFKELWERSFFQNVQDNSLFCKFRMHDLIHDLVRSVAQDECFAVDFEGTKEISENVRHLSVFRPAQNVPSILDKRNRLRSIIEQDIEDINESFLQTCFSRFKYLRMLVLLNSTFEAFPSSIVSLKHMRYLEVSGNERITKLPDAVCKLQSLEILSVGGCVNLEELPRDISKLISLRSLEITTKQTSFPDNGVGCMKSLRHLSITDCGNLTSLPRDMSYLGALHTLIIGNCEQLDLANGNYQLIPLRLRSLLIGEVPRMVALPEWLQGAANTLRVLCIWGCENLDALPEWLTSFTSLRILDLRVCPKLVSLPEGMHPLEVKIEDCPQLKRGM